MNTKWIRLLIKVSGLAAVLGVITICALATSTIRTVAAAAGDRACAPRDGVHFICGISHPADMVVVPHTAWLITSSAAPQGGIFLIKAKEGAWKKVFPDMHDTPEHLSKARFGSCSGPPEASNVSFNGLALAPGPGHMMVMGMQTEFTLYAVNKARDAVEVFSVRELPIPGFGGPPTMGAPRLTWIGCVALPSGVHASGVAASADGTIYVAVPVRPGMSMAEENAGKPTGAVYAWSPGASAFHELRGTELPGDTGVALSPDGHTLYVAAAGSMRVDAFSVAAPSHPMHSVHLSGFRPHNLHWDGHGLITAGMHPGGGFMAARINPGTMQATVFEHGSTSGGFSDVSMAMPVGNHVFFAADASGLGYRTMAQH